MSPLYSTMPSTRFLDWLRERSIAAGASPTFIGLVDQLYDKPDYEKEIELLKNENWDLKEANERLHLCLRDLVTQLEDVPDPGSALKAEMEIAKGLLDEVLALSSSD